MRSVLRVSALLILLPCLFAGVLAFVENREECRFLVCNLAALSGQHQIARAVFKLGRDESSEQNHINYVGYYGAMSKVRALSGHYDDALAFCNDSIGCAQFVDSKQIDHATGVAFHNRSWVYRQMGDFQNALNDEQKALVLRSDDGGELYDRALCFYLNKQYGNSLNDLNNFMKVGANVEAYELRSKVYDALGKKSLANLDRLNATHRIVGEAVNPNQMH